MKISKFFFILLITFCVQEHGFSQQSDSTKQITTFSGSVGITNNGFSIVPSFSLNSPAFILLFSWQKNRLSFDPDIRLTPDAKKGGMLFWLRYRLVEGRKFSLRVGTHPAFNLQTRVITENGVNTEITQARRFIASEVVPNYQIKPNWSIGMYYLQGNGLQKDGPQTTHFLTLNTSISNIKMGGDLRLMLAPAVYYLYLDGYEGNYFTATGILSHKKLPFTVQSTINQTLKSDLPGNKDFLWNVALNYNFSRKQKRVEEQ